MEEKKSTEPQISIVQRMLLYVRIANSFSDNRRFSSRRIIFIQKSQRNFTSSLQQLKVHLPQPNTNSYALFQIIHMTEDFPKNVMLIPLFFKLT